MGVVKRWNTSLRGPSPAVSWRERGRAQGARDAQLPLRLRLVLRQRGGERALDPVVLDRQRRREDDAEPLCPTNRDCGRCLLLPRLPPPPAPGYLPVGAVPPRC
jgi:hypothetical protein